MRCFTPTRIMLALVLFLFGTLAAAGAVKKSAVGDGGVSLVQYEVADVAFHVVRLPEAPFQVEFDAEFSGPGGTTLQVPGFYNGGTEWILRFSAGETGLWSYKTRSNLRALDGKTGKINIGKSNRHGAVTISKDNPRRFSYEDGAPCFLSAFECDWLFALDYDNPAGAPKSEHLLDLLAENGISQIVTTLYSYDVNWEKDPLLRKHPEHEYGGRDDIYPFLGTNKNPDFSGLNTTFFKRFDRIVDLMDERGIAAHLMIYVWNKNVQWPAAESDADNLYFDYVIKRYQAFPNVIWDVSKEALNNKRCSEAYGRERIERIRALDVCGRLVSVHDFGFCSRNTDAVDFISTQDWSHDIFNKMASLTEKFDKPVFNIEHGGYTRSPYTIFPGNYDDPEYCLRRNYLCCFAGAYATYYWQGAAWNAIIHNPFEQPDPFIKPKFEYYKHLQSFFTKFDYRSFAPGSSANAYGLQSNDGIYLIYVPKENVQISVYGQRGVAERKGTVLWFNTLSGDYSDAVEYTGGHFKSPWCGEADSILIRRTTVPPN